MGVFIGKGIVTAAPVDAATGALTGGYLDLGEVDNFQPGADIQTIEKRTNRDMTNALIARVETQINPTLVLALNEPTVENLKHILRGLKYSVTATPIVGEPVSGGVGTLAVGDFVYTKHPIQTWTALKDSAGTPATLVNNTDYKVVDNALGKLQILGLGSYVLPLKADYTPRAYSGVTALAAALQYYRVRIDGVNLVDGLKFFAEYYKARFPPADNFPLIGEDFAQYTLNGAVLADPTKAADAVLGQYGRFIQGLS
jgi:hypothetical protein